MLYFGGLISMKEQITKEKKSVITLEKKEISFFLEKKSLDIRDYLLARYIFVWL